MSLPFKVKAPLTSQFSLMAPLHKYFPLNSESDRVMGRWKSWVLLKF